MSLQSAGGSSQFARTRGRLQGGSTLGISYPHPFFDVSQTYLPQNMQSLFRWLRHYFLLNGFFSAVVYKLAEYPITDLIFSHKNEEVVRKWTVFFNDTLRYRSFQVEVGLDYFVYGNAFISLRYPIVKWLRCKGCGKPYIASQHRNRWSFRSYKFHLTCDACGHVGDADVRDMAVRSAKDITPIRWDPELIEIRYNQLTRRHTYYLSVPSTIRADVMIGKKDVVEDLPQVYLEACQKNEMVLLPPDEVFHMSRPTVSGFQLGWGSPLLLPVLKEAFQLQIMRKSQETVLMEHLIPLRVLFPQPAAGTADPFSSVPLPLWKEAVSKEIARWRWDPAYYPIMPLPIGHQTIGGDGKALMIQPEMQALIEQMIVSMGVPKEFIFGGASWSGSNVSLRTVENFFLGFIELQLGLVRFIQNKVAAVTRWPTTDSRFKPFRMADDLARKQLMLGANQAGKISDTTLGAELDFDPRVESELMMTEVHHQIEAQKAKQIGMARLQGEVGMISNKYQMQAQKEMQAMQQQMQAEQQQQMPPQEAPPQQAGPAPAPPEAMFDEMVSNRMGGGNGSASIQQQAAMLAQQISIMNPQQQDVAMRNVLAQSPQLYQAVMALLQSGAAGGQPQGQVPVEQPMPEVKPPRRAQS